MNTNKTNATTNAPRPLTWVEEILIDLSLDVRPEWCEVCADNDINAVPARHTTKVDGIRVCSDCAASWAQMTGPTLVIPFETNRDVADAFAWPVDAQLGDLPDGSNLYDKRARSC